MGEEQVEESPPDSMKGYLIDQSSSIIKKNTPFYTATMDYYLFLYENNLQAIPSLTAPHKQPSSLFCANMIKKTKGNNQTFPSDIPQSENVIPRSAVGVIDLLKVKNIAEEIRDLNTSTKEESEQELLLHFDNKYTFKTINQPKNEWALKLKAIQNYYNKSNNSNNDMQRNEILVRFCMMIRYALIIETLTLLMVII